MHAVVKDHACIYYIHNERRVSDIGDLPIRVRMVEGEGILEHSLIKASTSISLFITLGPTQCTHTTAVYYIIKTKQLTNKLANNIQQK